MKVFRKVFSIFAALLVSASLAVGVPASASQVRDYDSNAIIYGGVFSVKELRSKLKNGTGKSHQSGKQLTDLFAKNGIYEKDFGQLVEGYVTKDNKVIVKGKVVKTNVTTMGRHYIKGSTRDTRFSYPIYLRHPSVSFLSKKLPAYVSMNYDGTYAYAVIKSCGNIVKGPGVKVKKEVKHSITALKYEDVNGDGDKDVNESTVSGWPITISGNGVEKTQSTGSNGKTTFTGLSDGTYTVKEGSRNGWRNVTPVSQKITIKGVNANVAFGNQKIVVAAKHTITALKYEDKDGDSKMDGDEKAISGWKITLTGNGVNVTRTTDAKGIVSFKGLTDGDYVITEESRKDWKSITGLTVNVTLKGSDASVKFGNQKVEKPIIPEKPKKPVAPKESEVPAPIPVAPIIQTQTQTQTIVNEVQPQVTYVSQAKGKGNMPASGPAEAAAGAVGLTSTGGAAFAWIRSKKGLLSAIKRIK